MSNIPTAKWRALLKERKVLIGRRIAERRKSMNLTQTEFAERLSALLSDDSDEDACVTQPTVSSWEKGRNLPSLGRLLAMSLLLECDVGYLLGDYGERTHNALELCRETGLSEASIENLCFLHKWGWSDTARVIDFLLFDNRERYLGHNYRSVLDLLHFFLAYNDTQAIQKQVFTNGTVADYTDNDGTISANAIHLDERVIENAVLTEIQQALISIKAKMRLESKKEANTNGVN